MCVYVHFLNVQNKIPYYTVVAVLEFLSCVVTKFLSH
jgi:hypothetical protein